VCISSLFSALLKCQEKSIRFFKILMRTFGGFRSLEKGNAMTNKVKVAVLFLAIIAGTFWLIFRANFDASASPARLTLSAPFERKILRTGPEAPLPLRLFITAVKTDSRGRIITGETSDPVKTVVGAEAAGERAGIMRYTKIMHGASYIDGRPDPGTRIDPNNPVVKSGNELWPNREQPFRSQPRSLALAQDARNLCIESVRHGSSLSFSAICRSTSSRWLRTYAQALARSSARRVG
jgi:hypothetical protein